MATEDLSTLPNVKKWISGQSTSTDDVLLGRLLTSASRIITAWTYRPSFRSRVYSETSDGNGNARMMLRQWPVTGVSSLVLGGSTTIVASNPAPTGSGYLFEQWSGYPPGRPQQLYLVGHRFLAAHQNVAVTYTAGYLIAAEPQTVPTTNIIAVNAPYGSWIEDAGVTYANGNALTKVTGSPSTGQYQPDPSIPGNYNFAAGDAGQAVLISYSFVPAEIEQACLELVAERYAYKDRVGQKTRSINSAESVSYDLSDLTAAIKLMLQPYRRVVPS